MCLSPAFITRVTCCCAQTGLLGRGTYPLDLDWLPVRGYSWAFEPPGISPRWGSSVDKLMCLKTAFLGELVVETWNILSFRLHPDSTGVICALASPVRCLHCTSWLICIWHSFPDGFQAVFHCPRGFPSGVLGMHSFVFVSLARIHMTTVMCGYLSRNSSCDILLVFNIIITLRHCMKAQPEQAPATKPGSLSLVSRSCMVEGENWLFRVVLWSTHTMAPLPQ